MIKAVITKSFDGGFGIDVSGHASLVEDDGEIVCAAVSSVFYSLYGYLCNFCKEGLKVNALENGHASLDCGGDGEEAMKLTALGLWQLALRYPEQIYVENRAFAWKMRSCRDVSI